MFPRNCTKAGTPVRYAVQGFLLLETPLSRAMAALLWASLTVPFGVGATLFFNWLGAAIVALE